MKKYYILFAMLMIAALASAQIYVEGTIKKEGDNCVGIYAKPNLSFSHPPSNYVFALSVPDQGVNNPTITVTEELPGMAVDVNNPSPYTSSGRRFYDFNCVQAVLQPANLNWTGGNEYKIAKACFTDGNTDELIQLNDLASYGFWGFTDWYFELQGPGDVTPTGNPFYASPGESVVGTSGSDHYAETIASITLPIHILKFEALQHSTNSSKINWSVKYTLASSHFELYKSTDGIYWDNIARVVSTGAENYSYIDDGLRMRSSENVFYYRLKVVDRDGSYFFSDIRNVKFLRTDERSISIYPNPAGNKSVLDLSALNPADGLIEVLIYDMSGKQLIKSWIANNPEENIDLSGLPDSSYNLTVRQRDNVYNARLIKAGN